MGCEQLMKLSNLQTKSRITLQSDVAKRAAAVCRHRGRNSFADSTARASLVQRWSDRLAPPPEQIAAEAAHH